MNTNLSPAWRLILSIMIVGCVVVASAPAQIVHGDYTNSTVSFLNVTESGPDVPPAFLVPPNPTLSEGMQPTLDFTPTNSIQTDPLLPFDLKTKTSQLQMDIQAAPGLWFGANDKPLLQLTNSGFYSLSALQGPTPTSQAFASFTASYTLALNEVDNLPFSSGAPYSGTITLVPASASVTGPGGFASGTWSGGVSLDLNTIKAHFGLGPDNKITGMLLQYTANLSAASVLGQTTTSVDNIAVTPSVVPEPSTYALLALSAAGLGAHVVRRRRK
jgi:hypothetical protein